MADLSALRAAPSGYRVPQRVALVLPGILIDEVGGIVESLDPLRGRGQIAKLFDLLDNNRGRVLVGRNVIGIDRYERAPQTVLEPRHLIHSDLSWGLEFALPTREEWIGRGMSLPGTGLLEVTKDNKEGFKEERTHWSAWAQEFLGPRTGAFRASSEAQLEWARHPARVAEVGELHPRFHTGAWAQSLRSFPDRYSWPRWQRLRAWYELQMFLAPSPERRRNDWEDMQYAHLASYVGEIATADTGLRNAVEVLFPTTKVSSSLPTAE